MFNHGFGFKMMESMSAVELCGTKPMDVKRSWKERLFSLPWRPWITHKTIQVPNYKPAMFRVGDMIIYHPALKKSIENSVIDWNSKA